MQPQGFLGGLSSGLVGAVLTQRKKEEDQFYELRKNRASQLSALADHVRLEDLPQLMQGIDTILQAKKPEQADAAYGSVMAKIIEERYAEEQSAMARNQAIDQTAEEEQATAGQETPIGSITDKSGVVVPSSATVVSSPNPVPVKVNPGAYAKDKIRVKTEEGQMGRQIKLQATKEAELYKQKSLYEEKRQEEIRETNRLKIEAAAKNANEQILARGENENGDAVIVTRNRATGEQKITPIPGVQWPASVIAQDRLAFQKYATDAKIRADKEEWTAKLAETKRLNTQKIAESQAKIKEVENKISTGYYSRAAVGRKASDIVNRYKTELSGIDNQLDNVTAEINRVMGLDETIVSWKDKQERMLPLQKKQAELQYQRDVSMRMMETEIGLLNQEASTEERSGEGKVKVNKGSSTEPTETRNKKPQLTKDNILSTLGIGKKP